nr:MAG TPA: hypothetical protein [Caudoviricetes sp.]
MIYFWIYKLLGIYCFIMDIRINFLSYINNHISFTSSK